MTSIDLQHTHDHPRIVHGPAFEAAREALISTVTGVCFFLLAAAAGVFSLWRASARLLHRLPS